MQPFVCVEGVAAPFGLSNVDTDMIIPKQFLKTIERTGLGTVEEEEEEEVPTLVPTLVL